MLNKPRLELLKDRGYYLDTSALVLYLLEGSEHIGKLFEKEIFKENKDDGDYTIAFVSMEEYSVVEVEAYVSSSDYKNVVVPLYKSGNGLPFTYNRNLNIVKKLSRDKKITRMSSIRCSLDIDVHNKNNVDILVDDIMGALEDYINGMTDSNLMYQLRVGTTLLNNVLGGSNAEAIIRGLLLRYFHAIVVEGDRLTVGIFFYTVL